MVFGILALCLTGCGQEGLTSLSPLGPGAQAIATLLWVLLGLGGFAYLVVLLFLARSINWPGDLQTRNRRARQLLIGGGVVLPLSILLVTYGFTFSTLSSLTTQDNENREVLIVEVTGHQWWWEVHYPQYGITTASEIHIPVNSPVQLILGAEKVIHSFWAPALHGKRDAIPGQVTELRLEASQLGTFWGVCAEFCGTQHANMNLLVTASAPSAFEAWLANQQEPAAAPDTDATRRGLQVFEDAACGDCHTLAGVVEQVDGGRNLGPDLTHFASRQLLAATTTTLDETTLRHWISSPNSIKPGTLMPATELSEAEMSNLLAYLMSLK